MTRLKRALICLCVCMGLIPTKALALLIDAHEIALMMESTLVDLDANMIAVHHGVVSASKLEYVSKIEATGWQGRLFGTYGAHNVDIYYTGNVNYIGGPNEQFDIQFGRPLYKLHYYKSWKYHSKATRSKPTTTTKVATESTPTPVSCWWTEGRFCSWRARL